MQIYRGILYLSESTIRKIHEEEIHYTNGKLGVRNIEGLRSAVEQPKTTFGGEELYPDIFLKAAVLAHGISEGQVVC